MAETITAYFWMTLAAVAYKFWFRDGYETYIVKKVDCRLYGNLGVGAIAGDICVVYHRQSKVVQLSERVFDSVNDLLAELNVLVRMEHKAMGTRQLSSIYYGRDQQAEAGHDTGQGQATGSEKAEGKVCK